MAQRKHITEIGLGFYSDGMLLLHPKDLDDIDKHGREVRELSDRCHIYAIVTKPRVTYVPGSIAIGNGKTSGRFRYVRDGVASECGFHLGGEPNADRVDISPYPHTKLHLIRDDEIVFTAPAHMTSMICEHIDVAELRDLTVQYIGMSYADGRRSARDRLASHSTLQRVLADLNGDAPDLEALLVLAEFASPQTMITFDGRDPTLVIETDRDIEVALNRQAAEISEGQEIALIEAGLIRYFQPPYNEKYKHTFPAQSQKILAELYSIDFSGLTVEINTESLHGRLLSGHRPPGFHHMAYYDLHDPAIRRSFFDILGEEGTSGANVMSGPLF